MTALSQDEIKAIRMLTDSAFDSAFSGEVKLEAKQSMRVVYFIREADRRKHWVNEFSTLANYCARFGISNSDFYRKLSVLQTIRDLPEIEEKIIAGDLNPTVVAQVNTFCRSEAKLRSCKVAVEEKRELLLKAEGKSQRVVERELAKLSPQSAVPDKKRQISETLFSNHFISDVELEKKLTRLKEALSNALPSGATQNDLLHKICDIALREVEQKKTPSRVIRCVKVRSRFIPAEAKRQVRSRDGDRCSVVHAETGKRCANRDHLQFDHIVPFAKGGDHSIGNLRLVCRTHNQYFAMTEFGRDKMARFLPALRG